MIDACRKLKNNKASAQDLIRNEMIKSALPVLIKQIVKIFNTIISTGHFPQSWTEGIIVPVHKQGSKLDANNQRGITLSSCFDKLFCHVINERIISYLDNVSFLRPEQAGFRKRYRTTDHLYVLKQLSTNTYATLTKEVNFMAASLIFEKPLIQSGMKDYFSNYKKAGITGKLYTLIKSMYQTSVSRVKSKNSLSLPIDITQGIHQGNVLSPLLFSIFMNDVGKEMILDDVPILHDYKLNHLLYADDLLLLFTSCASLQNNIDRSRVFDFCKKWGLKIISDKSKVMEFSKGGRKIKDMLKFVTNETEKETASHYKYLGVNISNTGTFIVAEKKLSLKESRALFSIKQGVFNNNVKPSVIFRIFDYVVKTISLYGSEVWFGHKTSFHNKTIDHMFEMSLKGYNEFDKTFTRFYQYILGVHSKTSNFAVYSELGHVPLSTNIISSSISFWLQTTTSKSDSLIFKVYRCVSLILCLYPLVYSHFCCTIPNAENTYSYHWNKLTVNAQATSEGNR